MRILNVMICAAVTATSMTSFGAALKPGTYSSGDCSVVVREVSGNTMISVKAPKSQLTQESIVLDASWKSNNGPSLCTDSETVGAKAASSVYAQVSGDQFTIKCGGTFAPIDVSVALTMSADGGVTAYSETEGIAAVSLFSGISSGPIKNTKTLNCGNLVAQ